MTSAFTWDRMVPGCSMERGGVVKGGEKQPVSYNNSPVVWSRRDLRNICCFLESNSFF